MCCHSEQSILAEQYARYCCARSLCCVRGVGEAGDELWVKFLGLLRKQFDVAARG